ncbi:MAG: aspartate kinase, partial [Clostridia bacterium]|nr:aspartate kinase [Clostridia bacterium]
MSVKVCKFGGTSMADGNIITRVKWIVGSDPARKYIVVSAPGKRYSKDTKVTDLLYKCHSDLRAGKHITESFALVRARYNSIVKELNLDIDFDNVLDETEARIEAENSEDFTASRGEYLCARLVAIVLGAKFVDAENVILFREDGTTDDAATDKAIRAAVDGEDLVVFPGFYGRTVEGKVKTFSRGGSDITGAIVARAVGASVYENWTDVSGFLACDPR